MANQKVNFKTERELHEAILQEKARGDDFLKEMSKVASDSFRVLKPCRQCTMSNLVGVTENYVFLLEKGMRMPSKSLRLLLDCVEEKLEKKGGLK